MKLTNARPPDVGARHVAPFNLSSEVSSLQSARGDTSSGKGATCRAPTNAAIKASLAFAILLTTMASTAASQSVTVEKSEFSSRQGYRVSDGETELFITSEVGPRILRYGFVGGRNLFKVMTAEEEKWLTEGQDWRLYGGHRVWVGPEEPSYTYAADNEALEIEVQQNGLTATAPPDPVGIQKEMEVDMSGGRVTVTHRLTNRSAWPLDFAPWALTMMAPGGTGVSTFPPRGTHPAQLPPTNPLIMWAFTNLSDPRWTLLEKYLVLRNDPNISDPEKAGSFNEKTRAAYLLGSDLFVKRYDAVAPPEGYPDMGSTFETFTNNMVLELETLGPLETVKTGETIEHIEVWSLHSDIAISEWTDQELDRVLAPLLD